VLTKCRHLGDLSESIQIVMSLHTKTGPIARVKEALAERRALRSSEGDVLSPGIVQERGDEISKISASQTTSKLGQPGPSQDNSSTNLMIEPQMEVLTLAASQGNDGDEGVQHEDYETDKGKNPTRMIEPDKGLALTPSQDPPFQLARMKPSPSSVEFGKRGWNGPTSLSDTLQSTSQNFLPKQGQMVTPPKTGTGPECLLFNPKGSKIWVRDHFNEVPRYLFRLYAPQSWGETNERRVASRAARHPRFGKMDLFSMPAEEAAEVLNKHLWWDWDNEPRDNLMSWTSSLLQALQFGFYRHGQRFKSTPVLSDIKLSILDTSEYPPGTFLSDLALIQAFEGEEHHDLSKDDKPKHLERLHQMRLGSYGHGEYLSQGIVDIQQRSRHVSLQQLIDVGLFDILPELEEKQHWKFWAKRIKELRVAYFRDSTQTTKSEMQKTLAIAQTCFGDNFALPVAAMLLGLRKRQVPDETMLKAFLAWFPGESIEFSEPVFNDAYVMLGR
jgi:hypothetical protein